MTTVTEGGEGGAALSGVSPETESRESGVPLLDLVPKLEIYIYKEKMVQFNYNM